MHAANDLTPPAVEQNEVTFDAPVADLTPPTEKPKRVRKAKKEASVDSVPGPVIAKEPSNRSNLSKIYPEDAVITVLAEKNPKKAGSAAAAIFEFYQSGKTVGDFFAATSTFSFKDKKRPGTYADITYDVGHGYIKVG